MQDGSQVNCGCILMQHYANVLGEEGIAPVQISLCLSLLAGIHGIILGIKNNNLVLRHYPCYKEPNYYNNY